MPEVFTVKASDLLIPSVVRMEPYCPAKTVSRVPVTVSSMIPSTRTSKVAGLEVTGA